jgi:hypothetical protein
MFWLSYRVKGETAVVIRPEQTAIAAKLVALVSDETLRERDFKEALELDAATAQRIPKNMIGRRLTQAEARRLLRQIEA